MDADDRRIATLYTDLLARFGPGHKALHWSSPTAQDERFARLAAIGLESGHSLLDVGCGLGDFLAWLTARDIAVSYTGLDMTPAFIAECRRRFPGATFVEGNLFDPALPFGPASFDWVMASGVFAQRREDPEAYMRQGITRMMTLATRGLGINAQSTRAPGRWRWRLYHADPDRTLAWAQATGWSCWMVHDALDTDFTLIMKRPGDPALR